VAMKSYLPDALSRLRGTRRNSVALLRAVFIRFA
jgi:hypothetical protein